MRTLPPAGRIYVVLVASAALLVLVPLAWVPVDWSLLGVLAALNVGFDAISQVRMRASESVRLSLTFPITLAAVVLLPAPVAAAVALATALSPASGGTPGSWTKRIFNGAQHALSAACAGLVLELVTKRLLGTATLNVADFPRSLLPVLTAAVIYCLVNGLLLAGVMVSAEGCSFVDVWRGTLAGSVISYLGYGVIGLVMAVLWQSRFHAFAAVLVLLPLFVARWALTQYARQQAAYDATVRTLVQAVEIKDYYTRGHSERVSRASVMIGREIGMRADRLASLRYAGILHDVGKLGVPTRLLQKSGPLTPDESEAIQRHPVRGVEIVREIEFLGEAYAGIMHHHERLDGKGYPMGLTGAEIPEFARVIAVADAFDSMTSTRSYRRARAIEDAVIELRRWSGSQFDPVMVDALVRAITEQGWTPAEPLPEPEADRTELSRFDHDDPTTRLPVQPSPSDR